MDAALMDQMLDNCVAVFKLLCTDKCSSKSFLKKCLVIAAKANFADDLDHSRHEHHEMTEFF